MLPLAPEIDCKIWPLDSRDSVLSFRLRRSFIYACYPRCHWSPTKTSAPICSCTRVDCPGSNDILCNKTHLFRGFCATKYTEAYPYACASRIFHGTVLTRVPNFLERVSPFTGLSAFAETAFPSEMILPRTSEQPNFGDVVRYFPTNDSSILGYPPRGGAVPNKFWSTRWESNPTMPVLQTGSLPLADSCSNTCAGIEPDSSVAPARTREKLCPRVAAPPQSQNLVPREGFEPPRPFGHRVLSAARLPVPASRALNICAACCPYTTPPT